jgi:hypothetical protein
MSKPNEATKASNHVQVRLEGGPHDGRVTGISGTDLSIPAFLNYREEPTGGPFDPYIDWGYLAYQVKVVPLGSGEVRYVAYYVGRARHRDPVQPPPSEEESSGRRTEPFTKPES